jgi:glycosyltransferase involved in cell wall biosynthesis
MKTVVVEGWRFIPHSYAMVNHALCLELLRRPDVRLHHRDVPLIVPQWQQTRGLMSAEEEQKLMVVPPATADLRADATLRMGFPYVFANDPISTRTFTWGTSEFQVIEPSMVAGGQPREALTNAESTIIAPSNWSAAGFVRGGAPPEKVNVVQCGVDTSIFRPVEPAERAAIRRRLGWDGKFVVLNISAMVRNKGIIHLFKAAAAVARRIPTLTLALKGTDALYHSQRFAGMSLAQLTPAEKQEVAPRLSYLGDTLSTRDVATLYQAADVYASPYLAEGFNLPALEAAACGLAVVCTRGGATDDFVDDSFAWRIDSQFKDGLVEGGKMVQPSTDHLIQILETLAGDPALRHRASQAGPAWVRDRFTWRHSVDRLFGVMFPEG